MASLRDSAVRESWQRTLAGIPTLLGRLAYLSSLRDLNTGSYQHFGFAQKVGQGEADRVLRQSHAVVFQQWLCCSLEQQRAEALAYLDELGADKREIISNWLRMEPYQNWIPAESREAERRLFLADLAIVSELLRSDFGVASHDPDL